MGDWWSRQWSRRVHRSGCNRRPCHRRQSQLESWFVLPHPPFPQRQLTAHSNARRRRSVPSLRIHLPSRSPVLRLNTNPTTYIQYRFQSRCNITRKGKPVRSFPSQHGSRSSSLMNRSRGSQRLDCLDIDIDINIKTYLFSFAGVGSLAYRMGTGSVGNW